MEIVCMQRQHVAQIAALEAACFSDPWSEGSVAAELDNPLSCWLVCQQDGDVLGYVGSQTVLDQSDMMNIAVSPQARRRGIAQKLIQALTAQLKARGSRSLSLEVRPSNAAALALYQKLSFVQVGRRPGYYRHPREDGLILRKEWEL